MKTPDHCTYPVNSGKEFGVSYCVNNTRMCTTTNDYQAFVLDICDNKLGHHLLKDRE